MMSIKSWPVDERPREKLLSKGVMHLSNAELVAIFLRVGTPGKSAVDLARELMTQFGDLHSLFESELQQFCQIKGLGPAKYIQLQAVLELSRRYLYESAKAQDFLSDTQSTKKFLLSHFKAHRKEVFGCLFLNNKHRIISFDELFQGSLDRAEIYPREVVKAALKHHAASVIFVHNHTSGDPQPSQADIDVTQALKQALQLVDIQTLDHVIVGHNKTVSFAEHNLL